MKLSYGECVDRAENGTSGDQVWDILESWKADAYAHLQNIHELQQENARLLALLEKVRLYMLKIDAVDTENDYCSIDNLLDEIREIVKPPEA